MNRENIIIKRFNSKIFIRHYLSHLSLVDNCLLKEITFSILQQECILQVYFRFVLQYHFIRHCEGHFNDAA